ncbi:response regulator [Dehalobacterium formicoaceticum]|uniref:Stage 0 sporulation protein A homolog n=1 Tax=Dehalobacterium formicoaceticum TaxID=51515 RepID=A0ABT1Y3K8_9FIRM|nr:response regulator [Dehalobacterium formicoaceticum]MCR6545452.1 response regulator [Dehalobacterium formicoaceticum]
MGEKILENASILIVDDQLGVRKLLFEALKSRYREVLMVASGLEAIEIVQKSPPDLVLVDMKMPRMNGLETIKRLRDMAFENPIILMTAYGELGIVTEALKMGVKHHITKPFDIKELRNLIQETLTERVSTPKGS